MDESKQPVIPDLDELTSDEVQPLTATESFQATENLPDLDDLFSDTPADLPKRKRGRPKKPAGPLSEDRIIDPDFVPQMIVDPAAAPSGETPEESPTAPVEEPTTPMSEEEAVLFSTDPSPEAAGSEPGEAVEPTDDEPVAATAPAKRRKPRFSHLLAFYAALLAILIVIALAVFWRFLATYERVRPSNVIANFLDNMPEDYWQELVHMRVGGAVSDFEDRELIENNLTEKLKTANVKYVEKANGQEDLPEYRVLFDGMELLTVRLVSQGKLMFGLEDWRVFSYNSNPEKLPNVRAKLYEWTVPSEAVLTINGIQAGEEAVYASGNLSGQESELEPKAASRVTTYQAVLFTEPNISVTLNGEELVGENGVYLYPETCWNKDYMITVPSEASVLVNGVALSDQYLVSLDAYPSTALEPNVQIYNKTYRLPPMFSTPTVQATVAGISASLSLDAGNQLFLMEYPKELLHTVTISVPAGASVTMNGLELSKNNITQRNKPFEELVPYEKYLMVIPAYDYYEVTGLYQVPTFTVKNGSLPLNVSLANGDEPSEYIHHYEGGSIPRIDYDEIFRHTAVVFMQKYIYFSTQGYVNLDNNLKEILTYTIKNSEAYKKINSTYLEMSYMHQWSLTYNQLVISDLTQYSADAFSCNAYFDINKSLSYTENGERKRQVVNETGHMHILFIKQGNDYKAVSFSFYE